MFEKTESEQSKSEKTEFFSDLMMPLSIIAGVQAAILISLVESQSGINVFYEKWLLAFTLGLLVYCFIGHAADSGIISWPKLSGNMKYFKLAFLILVLLVIVFTVELGFSYVNKMD